MHLGRHRPSNAFDSHNSICTRRRFARKILQGDVKILIYHIIINYHYNARSRETAGVPSSLNIMDLLNLLFFQRNNDLSH